MIIINRDYVLKIQTYLQAIGELNSVFTGSDAWYSLNFGVLTEKENLFISKKMSLFEDYYQKVYIINGENEKTFIGNMVSIKNWKDELIKTCNNWFYGGAYFLSYNIARKEHPLGDLKDIIEDAKNKTKSVIGNRFFPTTSFLKLLNNLFANNLSKVYVFNNSLAKQKENIIDKYLFVCKDVVYILQFDLTD